MTTPEDTPPATGSMSGATGRVEDEPNHGPVSGNRTPMVVTLVALSLIVLLVAGFVVASLIPS